MVGNIGVRGKLLKEGMSCVCPVHHGESRLTRLLAEGVVPFSQWWQVVHDSMRQRRDNAAEWTA